MLLRKYRMFAKTDGTFPMLDMKFLEGKTLRFSDYILLTLILIIGLAGIIVQNEGNFIYALDDAYIHLAIGKNIAEHGIWGVTRHEFSSASSSPLWTVLLAGLYHISGKLYLYIPLFINIITCYGLVYIVSAIARNAGVSAAYSLMAKIFMILCLPFLPLIAGGMENALFAFLVLLFIHVVFIRDNASALTIGAIAILMVAARYEGAFVIAAATVVLSMKKQWKKCLIIIIGGILPIIVFGLYFISQGGEFFPNSLLIKGNVNGSPYAIIRLSMYKIKDMVQHYSPLPFLCFFLYINTYLLWKHFKSSLGFSLFLLASVTFTIHLLLAQMGWLYRYEAYLLAMSVISIILSAQDIRTIYNQHLRVFPRYFLALIALYTLAAFGWRLQKGHREALQSSHEIFLQQIQMAHFVKTFFPDNTIVMNDIGAVCYFTDIHCIDAYGLATIEIAKAKKVKAYDCDMLDSLSVKKNADLAIVYPQWINSGYMFSNYSAGKTPSAWKKAGSLILGKSNYVIGGDTVSFYAIKENYFDSLRTSLRLSKKTLSFGKTSHIIVE